MNDRFSMIESNMFSGALMNAISQPFPAVHMRTS